MNNEKNIRKANGNKRSLEFTMSVCSIRISCVFFLFISFLNFCKAQTAQAVSVSDKGKLRLSGIYSSKKTEASSLNPLSKGEGAILEKEKGSTNFFPSDFPINNQDYKEEIEKRTTTSRTFDDGQGNVVIQYSSKNINYSDSENKFQPINTSLVSFTSSSESVDGIGFWAATEQQFPVYLYEDGSTALTSDDKKNIVFNQNCKINEKEINVSDFTVGEEGMLIKDAGTNIDKRIVFYENMIETDYIIHQPVNNGKQNLVFSEEIDLPDGYYIRQERGLKGEAPIVVYSPSGREQARFKAPVFYDAANTVLFGKYNLFLKEGKNSLQIIVPEKWLNDVNRVYPVTIDPVVTGPTSNYPPVYMNSCASPNYASDSMVITIPADITITGFIVEDSYFADALSSPPALMKHGKMKLSTVCGAVTFSCQGTASDSSGTCYLVPNTDLKSNLACCFSPSCVDQTFYLTHALTRDNYGPGCNQDYIYYSPVWPVINNVPFNTTFYAFIIGKTVETAQVEWSVSPATLCSDNCTVFLEVTTNFGVPPYTITHPWAGGPLQYGTATGSCTSAGTETITLTIPGCPTTCGTSTTLDVPPPVIIDVCGNSVTGLSAKTITVKPVPVATAASTTVCSGSSVSIPVSSCVTGSTFQWTGNNGTSGTGNISDMVVNPGPGIITINYSVIPEANGCTGLPLSVSAEIDTLPVINGGANDTIDPGVSTQLTAIGGLSYIWSPSAGLSCVDCPDPLAAPLISTTYYVTGTNEYGCSNGDTIDIFVTQGDEVLYIPNSFTPNDNNLNDLFYAYGTSIKIFDLQIYDRWGELIFRTNDIKLGWDGKYRGKLVEGGVYVYSVDCEWLSGVGAYRKGIVSVLR